MTSTKRRLFVLAVPCVTLIICILAHFFEINPTSPWFRLVTDMVFMGGSISATLALLFAIDARRAANGIDSTQKAEETGRKPPTVFDSAAQKTPEAEKRDPEPENTVANTEESGSEPKIEASGVEDPPKEPERKAKSKRQRLPAYEEERRVRRIQQLEREVEILASMRDLSLIANDSAEFEEVLTRSLDILQNLFEATEIQVFIVNVKAPESLHLAALRRKKKTTFGNLEGPLQSKGTRKEALQAIHENRGGTRFVNRRLNAHVVLRADQEVIGVLSVFIPQRERQDAWAAETYFELGQIAKHTALVINKPTLYDRAVLDALTGLYSKRHYLDQVPKAMSAARRHSTPLALIVIDIDHFKLINDNHGHVSGDFVLAAVGRTIRETIRDYDAAYRYGGEEICIVAPGNDYPAALAFGERLRLALESQRIVGDKGQELRITASLGVCLWTPQMSRLSDFLADADEWLYKAKQEGRNQVRPRLKEIGQAPSKMAGAASKSS
jgi:diguanylate cyclase (GGDEF)-like protein